MKFSVQSSSVQLLFDEQILAVALEKLLSKVFLENTPFFYDGTMTFPALNTPHKHAIRNDALTSHFQAKTDSLIFLIKQFLA